MRYDIMDGYGGTPESIDDLTMGPEGYLYAAANNLGLIDIIRLDVNSGLTVVPHDYVCCGLGVPFASFSGGSLHRMKFDLHGDLFTGASDYNLGFGDNEAVIRRFDGDTGALKGELSLGDNRFIQGIGFASNGEEFYVLHAPLGSIQVSADRTVSTFSYSSQHNTFTPIDSFLVSPDMSNLWVAPDGAILLNNVNTATVDRYSPTGSFIDQFLTLNFHDLDWIEGRLIGLNETSQVLEIDTLTGNMEVLVDAITSPDPVSPFFWRMAAFSVVPEPNTLCLSFSCLIIAYGISRQRTDV